MTETLILPLKNLGQVQFLNKMHSEAIETLCRSVQIAYKALEGEFSKEQKNSFRTHLSEMLYTLYSLYDSTKSYERALQVSLQHNDIAKQLHGEKSSQYCYSLFLKAKILTLKNGSSTLQMKEPLEILSQAIQIEEELQEKKDVKSALLGRMYYMIATLHIGLKQFPLASKCLASSKEILTHHEDFKDLVTEIDKVSWEIKYEAVEEEEGQGARIGMVASGSIILGASLLAGYALFRHLSN
mmetsp:Transcript_40085/g.38605  ORF Transcript_40085/g.38605 Transcript_40085/m.38605 type:complete len:241 (-) Transcript_40085:39-761(-)